RSTCSQKACLLSLLPSFNPSNSRQIISPRKAIPIHYNDYTVFKSPLDDFIKAVQDAGLANRVDYLSHGETYVFDVSTAARLP
ncbi:hypothetical protein, partial [Myxacorys almedinensis]|uniref:hypothetical protein n=1 Tax=Myxacorys almedinensis TaxID=2651157 RepID=UPI00192ED8B0